MGVYMRFSRLFKCKPRLSEPKLYLLIGLCSLCFFGLLVRGHYGFGNERPEGEITAQHPNISYISKVIPRAQETWLIRARGSDLDDRPTPIPETATILNTLMDKTARKNCTQLISRLEQEKPMRDLACFDGDVSLLVSPDSKTLVLLTNIDIPDSEAWQQHAVFKSDDQGETWRWLKKGFFPEADWMAHSMKFYMHGTRELWTWKNLKSGNDDETDPATWSYRKKAENLYTELYYSPDFGENVETIQISNTLFPNLGEGAYSEEIKLYIAQLTPDRAMIWISQRFFPNNAWRDISYITTQLELRRVDNRWQMQPPRHLEGLFIFALQGTDKRAMAIMTLNNWESGMGVAEFDSEQQNWKRVGEMPNPFFPLPTSQSIVDFQAEEKVLLLNAWVSYSTRWLYPITWFGSRSESAVYAPLEPYYSLDQGRSWKQLAIWPIAFQPEEGRIFWYQDDRMLSAVLGKNE
jgi:hypothetical protein